MKILAVIPARYESSRFPGKPLVDLHGKPMIQHVYERVQQVPSVGQVLVATDDERIINAVRAFGGQACMTSPDHPTGTDRIVEVIHNQHCEWVLNVQGDEPTIAPDVLETLIQRALADGSCPMATLVFRSDDPNTWHDPHVVKAILAQNQQALYFSRSPVPYARDQVFRGCWKHFGVYLYRRDFLLEFANWPSTPLEQQEQLEQLRVLENGYSILCVESPVDSIGVDVPEDLTHVAQLVATEMIPD